MYEEYRNWEIHWCGEQRAYEAVSPDYEPIWTGEDGGWIDGERFTAPTLTEVYAEIDERIAEQADYQRDCAADAALERRWEEETAL
jgi:hypothetical protein